MMRTLFLLLLLLFSPAAVWPQSSWEQLLRDWMAVEDLDFGEDTFELLAGMADNKLDLNQATREDLERLPFLSAQQVEGLFEYLDRFKPMRTLNELLLIPSLDRDTRRLLACFVCCDSVAATSHDRFASWASLTRYGHHTLQATLKAPMYERKGDRSSYLGYRYRHDLRYQFNYNDRVKFGLTGAQDAGEPFFANKNTLGYDFYTYYLQLRRMGRFEELNLGMYRVQLGMGLVMNTGFHLGKLAMLQSLGRSPHVLTAHASRSSASYLHGAAATLRLAPAWQLTAFASYRPLDATLNTDGSVRTIVTDGYHRTATELSKKNNTHLADLGFRLGWKATLHGGLASANVNAVYSHFDRRLVPYAPTSSQSSSQLYRRYALAGNDFFNASVDYAYTNHRFSFSGETAINRQGALAAIHSLSCRLTDQWTLMLLHRYYDKQYTAYHAYAFSEGSSVQNEHGVYVGASWNPSRTFQLKGYVDYAHFPWVRYQVSLPSDAFDGVLHARTLIYSATLEARYRFHLRQRDNTAKLLLQNRYEHRARLRLSLPLLSSSVSYAATPSQPSPSPAAALRQPSPSSLALVTQADGAFVDNRTSRSRGIMLSQQAVWNYRRFRLNAMFNWFHTDSYDSRLYLYEPSVRYDFSFPMYYGHGLHYALMARADWNHLSLIAKIGTTDYFDRAFISSGQQQIDRSSMTDLLFQLRYRF